MWDKQFSETFVGFVMICTNFSITYWS